MVRVTVRVLTMTMLPVSAPRDPTYKPRSSRPAPARPATAWQPPALQAEAGQGCRAGTAVGVQAAGRVVAADHAAQPLGGQRGDPARPKVQRLGQQPLRQPVVFGLPALADVER